VFVAFIIFGILILQLKSFCQAAALKAASEASAIATQKHSDLIRSQLVSFWRNYKLFHHTASLGCRLGAFAFYLDRLTFFLAPSAAKPKGSGSRQGSVRPLVCFQRAVKVEQSFQIASSAHAALIQ
jgi:hypothetical protein